MIINKTYPGLIIQTTVKGSFLNPALIEEAFTLAKCFSETVGKRKMEKSALYLTWLPRAI
jgi:hypothetical protein